MCSSGPVLVLVVARLWYWCLVREEVGKRWSYSKGCVGLRVFATQDTDKMFQAKSSSKVPTTTLFTALITILLCSTSISQEEDQFNHEEHEDDEYEHEMYDDEHFTFELSATATANPTATATATLIPPSPTGKGTFGQRWLLEENSKRNVYYKKKSVQLWKDVKQAMEDQTHDQDDGPDPFLIVWDLMNTLVAIIELEPQHPHSWIFAGQMSLYLLVTNEVFEDDVIGFFARGIQLEPNIGADHVLDCLQVMKAHTTRRPTLMLLDRMLDTFGNSAELPVVPMNSRAYALLSSVHYPGVKDQLDQIERTKAIGGNSAVEEGDMVPDPAPKDPKTNDKDGGDDAPRRSDHDHHGVEFKTIDLWTTHLVAINLMTVLNMTKKENQYLSKLAIEHFMEYKTYLEREHEKNGQPPPQPNDLDDGFFSYQDANPQHILSIENDNHTLWNALYKRGTEGRRIYQRLVHGIREACEKYIHMYARPGTLEDIRSKNNLKEDFWSAVYIPDTVHSHHVHQMSIVSAVYYSKVGAQNTPIVFSDPRGATPIHNYEQHVKEHDYEPEAPFHQQYTYFPEEGELILFPSWLVHKVPAHHGKEDRVSWPYNYNSASNNWDAWSRTVLV